MSNINSLWKVNGVQIQSTYQGKADSRRMYFYLWVNSTYFTVEEKSMTGGFCSPSVRISENMYAILGRKG